MDRTVAFRLVAVGLAFPHNITRTWNIIIELQGITLINSWVYQVYHQINKNAIQICLDMFGHTVILFARLLVFLPDIFPKSIFDAWVLV